MAGIRHARIKITPTLMPDLVRPLFHNYEISSINLNRNWRLIIKTVMQGGELEQIRWAIEFYGREKFERVLYEDLNRNQTLARPVANFWSVVLWNKPLPPLQKGERWKQTRRISEAK